MRFCNRVLTAAAVVAFVAVLIPAASNAAEHFVDIQGISFVPPTLTIRMGDKVTWTNSSALQHTVTSGTGCVADGLFGSALFGAGGSFSFTFENTGTIPYYCIPHCFAGMTGTITVNASVATENATWGAIKKLYDIEDAE